MRRCHTQHADLWLDGTPWRFKALWELCLVYDVLRSHLGVQWPQWEATIGRLYPLADARLQLEYKRSRGGRLGGRPGGRWRLDHPEYAPQLLDACGERAHAQGA